MLKTTLSSAGFKKLYDDEAIYLSQEEEEEIDKAAEYIINKYERVMLYRLLCEDSMKMSSIQKNYILSNVKRYNTDKEIGYAVRKRIISECIRQYLEEGKTKLYFEGFVIFRLLPYESVLKELIERLTDDRLAEIEYGEFIRLLQYFVNLNDKRPPLANILVRADGVYEIFDKDFKNITKKCIEEFITEESELLDISFDDLLISMLITLAPKKIIVHGCEKIANKELFKTIEKVFKNSVSYCASCPFCQN